MEIIAEDLKRKVLQFHTILKNHTLKEINLIKDLFMTLHLKDFD